MKTSRPIHSPGAQFHEQEGPAPYHPIIYVRGLAATQGEIEETVADPYMGFNSGSTKARMAWNGDLKRYYFESPLVRLISEHSYNDLFVDGDDLLMSDDPKHRIPYRSLVIYRYYDEASRDFGSGEMPPIEHFARGLGRLITRLRDKVCANPDNDISPADFRVYLVAHSMVGLICRPFLQNPAYGEDEARRAVDKLFTYATPHNGIDMRIVRNFPPERIFNLVRTNPRDYTVAAGLSAWAAGEASDGLVRIENATTHGPAADGNDLGLPRAFVNRSQRPHLFLLFLDPSKSMAASGSVSFAFDVKVLLPDYEVNGVLFMMAKAWPLKSRSNRRHARALPGACASRPGHGVKALPRERRRSTDLQAADHDPRFSHQGVSA